MNKKQNSPLQSVLSFILKQKEIDKKRVSDFDALYKNQNWYSDLIDFVKRGPPERYVCCLEIDEDYTGIIKEIKYHYNDSNKQDNNEIIIQINGNILKKGD